VSLDHGRRARRTIKAALAPAWIEFAGAAQVAQLRRTVTKKGKKIVEVVYLITSDRTAVYRFRTRHTACDVQFGRSGICGHDHGSCLSVSCT
jgi:hypothetical protein